MINKVYRRKAGIVFLFYGGMFVFLLYRLFCVQFLHNDFLQVKAKNMHEIELELKPTRGDICDRNGNLLAISVPMPSVYADPSQVEEPEETAQQLARLLDIEESFIYSRITKEKRFVWLERKVTLEKKEEVAALDLPGIGFIEEPTRFYPKGNMAAHLLGFVDLDNKGLEGVEAVCDSYLAGKSGKRLTEKDASGREVLSWRNKEIAPIQGYRVVLTIDEVIQDIVEEELDKACEKYNPQAAMSIVLDPQTGEILALANRPTYNPNEYSEAEADERRNRILTDTFEAGSVFKIFAAGAALNEGIYDLDDTVFCENGVFRVPGGLLRDSHAYDTLTFQQVVEKSSNIGMAKVGMKLGKEKLYEYLIDFGFGEKTGIMLPGEVTGVLRVPARWSRMSITRIPMGHEVSTTVLQLAIATAAVANGGKLMKPIIVKRIEDVQGRTVKRFSPQLVREVLSPEAIDELKIALMGVVGPEGTARRASLKDFQVAGKTGTAQKLDPDGTYSHKYFVASFSGFVPVQEPRMVILTVFDAPRPLYYGGTVAAPVFKNIAEKTLTYLNVEPENIMPNALVAKN